MHGKGSLSIWFFIGLLLTIYGILIAATGLAEWGSPPPVVLSNLHAAVWWGLFLLVMGLFYLIKFFPRKRV
jgi:uncharacterized membrane protein HdeD (DUF308 family)